MCETMAEADQVEGRYLLDGCTDTHFGPRYYYSSGYNNSPEPNIEENELDSPVLSESDQRRLRKVRSKLDGSYRTTLACMPTLETEEDRQYLKIAEYFIEPDILETDLSNRNSIRRPNLSIEDIFDSYPENHRPPKRILLVAEAGFGKTSLCKKIAYDWASLKEPHYLSRFRLLFYVNLKDLMSKSLKDTIYSIFLSALRRNEQKKHFDERKMTKIAEKLISRLGTNVLFILDGCEGCFMNDNVIPLIQEFIQADTGSIFSGATVVFTCRPLIATFLVRYFDRCLKVNGFLSKDRRHDYVRTYSNQQYVDSILTQVEDDPRTANICQCPLTLHNMCLFQEVAGREEMAVSDNCRNFRRVCDVYDCLLVLLWRVKYDTDEENYDEVLQNFSNIGKCFLHDNEEYQENEKERINRLLHQLKELGMMANAEEQGWGERQENNQNSPRKVLLHDISQFTYLEYFAALYMLYSESGNEMREKEWSSDVIGQFLKKCFEDNNTQIRNFLEGMVYDIRY